MSHIFNSFLELKELAANFDESKVRRLLTKLNNPTFFDGWFYKHPIQRIGYPLANYAKLPRNPWRELIKTLLPLSGDNLKITLQKEISWFWSELERHKLWLRK